MHLKACQYCGRIHSAGHNCGKRPERVKETTDVTKLRTCRRWDKTRKDVYERDHYMCRVCFAQRRIMTYGIEAHHIIPLAENRSLAYDLDNLITLCTKHHKAADRGRIDRETLLSMAKTELSVENG